MRHAEGRKDGRDGSSASASAALRRKLMAYGLGAGGAVATSLAGADSAWGVIIYTDPIDATAFHPNGKIYLDLDGGTVNSGPYDFRFLFPYGKGPEYLKIASGAVVTTTIYGENFASKLNQGDSIGPGSFFSGSFFTSVYMEKYGRGPWQGGATAYVGLRIGTGSNYGWVRLDYNDAANALTLLDFAYESTPGTAILAGATSSPPAVPVPEPNSLLLAAAGASGLSLLRRRRKDRDAAAAKPSA